MHKIGLSLLAATVLLSACTTPSQSEVEADVDTATRAVIPTYENAWQSAQQDDVDVDWIAAFNDPLLESLVAEAQQNNLDLSAAAAGVEQARALARQAQASYSPDLGLSLGANRSGALDNDALSPSTGLSAGLQASWEVDLWGRIRSGNAQATASAKAAEADYRYAQYSIAAGTAIAYFVAIETQLQLDIASNSLGLLDKTLNIVSAQHAEGVATAQDLALTKSDLASAADQVALLEGARDNALRALELLLGRYPGAELVVNQELPSVPPAPPAGVPSALLENRPDLIAAERQVAAAFNAVNQAKAARLPNLSLTGSLGGSSTELSDLLNPANVAWSAGSSLLAPLFDGGRLRENVNIANAQQEAALASYASKALAAFSEVESALTQGQVLVRRERALEEAAEQAAEAFRIAELRYREGETSLLDLLTIQQRVIASQSNLTSVQRLLLEQRVNLNLALGGGW